MPLMASRWISGAGDPLPHCDHVVLASDAEADLDRADSAFQLDDRTAKDVLWGDDNVLEPVRRCLMDQSERQFQLSLQ